MGNHLKRGQSEPIKACRSGTWYLLMDCVYLHSPGYLRGNLFFSPVAPGEDILLYIFRCLGSFIRVLPAHLLSAL